MQSTWAAKIFGDREDPRVRLHALFGGAIPAGGQPPAPALAWARAVLGRRRHTPSDDVVTTVRILREAEPRLTLKSATFLARHTLAGD